MKINKKHFDPVNYKLQNKDIESNESFESFLDHLTDVPSSIPFHNISIDEAGIFNQQIFVYVKDIIDRNRTVPVLCDLSMTIKLEKNRGIHMSRIEEALFETVKENFEGLDDFAKTFDKNEREAGLCVLNCKN
jgi:GTP cyclohydrolase FolE2